jgi:hypothetical protein
VFNEGNTREDEVMSGAEVISEGETWDDGRAGDTEVIL